MGSKMSLTAALKKAAYVAPITIAIAANAMAETNLPRIEPSTADLSRPITTTVCVDTTPGQPGLSAWDKLVAIMNARGQMIAIEGNQVIPDTNTRQLQLITVSNNWSGREGYLISSRVPNAKRKEAPSFCLEPAKFSKAINQKETPGVPQVLNQGQLGIALNNHDKAGTKVRIAGSYYNGSLFAVIFNSVTNKGTIYMSDAAGNKAAPIAALEDVDFSEKMKNVLVANAEKANSKPSLVAAANPALTRAP